MNIASIDIGSNTVILLIVEIDEITFTFRHLLSRYRVPRIGKGLIKDGIISKDSIASLKENLYEYKILIEKYNCAKILAFATNAMRVAKNAREIIQTVCEDLEIEIKVISGIEEAFLSFLGTSNVVDNNSDRIVIDIGGGSTEIISGSGRIINNVKSFSLGAVSLTEKFISSYPVSERELNFVRNYIENHISQYCKDIPSSSTLIAVAGTPTTLSAIKLKLRKYDERLIEGSILTQTDLHNFLIEFTKSKPEELLARYGKLVQGREDVIQAGTVILSTFLKILNSDKLLVSARGIRYGIIEEYLFNIRKQTE